jgi:hypothetical protein
MKGMLPGIAALVAGLGCGRTLLPLDGVGAEPGGLILVPLGTSSTGVVEDNAAGILGQWYAYGDGWGIDGPDGPCETNGHFPMVDCSSIWFPSPAAFPQTIPGRFCLKGTAAEVIDGDYADIYGIGISLDLNNSGGVKMPYDAPHYGVIGFQFDIENIPTAPMAVVRVEFPTRETIQNGFVFWGKPLTTPLANGGKNIQVLFQDVKQLFESPGEPPPFNSADVQSIQFHVPSVAGNPIPVGDLCVSNLQAIVQN